MADEKNAPDKDPRDVMVKALRPHRNSYGDKFLKGKGDTYRHPRPAGEIAGGVVTLATGKAASVTAPTKKPSTRKAKPATPPATTAPKA